MLLRSCLIARKGRECAWQRKSKRAKLKGSETQGAYSMQITRDARPADVLGTLMQAAPKPQDFQFVKFRVDGEVVRLTLDRPEHNLLNERMLAEVAGGINAVR